VKNPVCKPVMSKSWKNPGYVPEKIYTDNTVDLRQWQKDCHKRLNELSNKHKIVNSPTGSGKTTMICYMAICHLLSHKNSKCIIVAPTRDIGSGFSKTKKYRKKNAKWVVQDSNDLCGGKGSYESKARRVIEFLSMGKDILPTEKQ